MKGLALDITKSDLEEMIAQLEIQIESIRHITFSDDTEIMGEVFSAVELIDSFLPNDTQDGEDVLDIEFVDADDVEDLLNETDETSILFLNPIKILRDTWIGPDGDMKHTNYFTEFNPCVDSPYLTIPKHLIKYINPPNAESLVEYLKAIYKIYCPIVHEIPDGDLTLIAKNLKLLYPSAFTNKNVIDFKTYHKKRLDNTF